MSLSHPPKSTMFTISEYKCISIAWVWQWSNTKSSCEGKTQYSLFHAGINGPPRPPRGEVGNNYYTKKLLQAFLPPITIIIIYLSIKKKSYQQCLIIIAKQLAVLGKWCSTYFNLYWQKCPIIMWQALLSYNMYKIYPKIDPALCWLSIIISNINNLGSTLQMCSGYSFYLNARHRIWVKIRTKHDAKFCTLAYYFSYIKL